MEKNHGDKNTEYIEANNNIRHYSNLRFAQLTIYIAVTGALIDFFFDKMQDKISTWKLITAFLGIFLSILFWIMEESATRKWKAFKLRADQIENELGYKQLTNFPKSNFFSATSATRILYLGGIVFWLIIIDFFR